MNRVLEWALAQAWAVQAGTLRLGLEIAARHSESPEVVEERLGKPLSNDHDPEDLPGGVRVLPVRGPIMRYANVYHRISGGTSVEILARQVREAADDPAVRSIVLAFDSPGGQATSIVDLAGVIRGLRDSKPVVAYADGSMASGAYWLGSAAAAVIASPTSVLGSIGVVQAVRRLRPPEEGSTIEFVSSGAPLKRIDPAADPGRAEIQRVVDELHAVFERDVAAHRGVTPAYVREHFGRGGVRVGADAVRHRMADAVGSLDVVLSDLRAGRLPGRSRSSRSVVVPMIRGVSSMSWRENALRFFFGGDDGQADAPADLVVPEGAHARAPEPPRLAPARFVPSRSESEIRAEVEAAVRAEYESRAAAERAESEAKSFAAALVRDRRLPAHCEAQVASVHRALAGNPGVLAEFRAVVESRPVAEDMTREAVVVSPIRVDNNQHAAPAVDDAAEVAAINAWADRFVSRTR